MDNLLTSHKIVLSSNKSVITNLKGLVYSIEDLKETNKLNLFKDKLLTGRSTGQLVNLLVPSISSLYLTLDKELAEMIICNARCVVTKDGEYRWTHNVVL